MRVAWCHFAADFHGGSDRGLHDVVTHLPRDQFTSLMLLRHEDPMAEVYRAQGIAVETFHLVPPRKALEPLKLLRFFCHFWPAVFRLRRAIRRFNADVVHVNTLFNLQGPAAARLAGRPLVWHVRELLPGSRVFRLLTRIMNRLATRIIATSQAVADETGLPASRIDIVLRSIDCSRFDTLPPASETRRALGLEETAQVIFCPGRIEPWKGQHVLVEALPAVFDAHPEAVALCAGAPAVNKPEYFDALRARCGELDISGRVYWLGRRDDVPALMAASDLVVLPSVTPEPFGLTVVEAMAAGCPVVATAAGGPLQTLANGETGLLARPDDSTDLAAKINAILDEPVRARAMGAAGTLRARELFSIEREAAEIGALLRQTIGAPRT
jgi:glycosyltransferase involved in cell wall biosynthesis